MTQTGTQSKTIREAIELFISSKRQDEIAQEFIANYERGQERLAVSSLDRDVHAVMGLTV